ncbi:MAG: alpha/beta fold hydrolase [candidate division Zixibacteria bacterium]|nr:alpha/beta fold hydrolase [candidate division Zixibacteria bacterium]
MHVARYGTGSRVFVGFHGWTGSHRTYAPLSPFLPAHFTLYAPDLPGCGKSGKPSVWTSEALVEEIVRHISPVVPETFTLIGNCSGAIVALLTAPRLIERIDRLVLIDPFAYMPWYFRVFLAGRVGRYAYASTFANPAGRWITNTALRSKRTAQTDLTDSFADIDHAVTYAYLRMFADLEGIARFGALHRPTDIAYGERTFGAIKNSLPAWKKLWPHACIREMKGAGHLPIQEATEQVAGLLFGENGVIPPP